MTVANASPDTNTNAAATAHKVAVVVGTRPEAIKLAPVLAALRKQPSLKPLLIATSQHREMLKQALDEFELVPDIDLELMQAGQDLGSFTARAIGALTDCFHAQKPKFLLVQGDTSTVTAACLAAFYQGIPIGHVEAGLRSWDLSSPFPEEVNRRIASATSNVHFAPTDAARLNLLAEGIPAADVFVTGNTVVDALHSVPPRATFNTAALNAINWAGHRNALVTIHRRESLAEGLDGICDALLALVNRHADLQLVFPVHLNPRVREVVFQRLSNHPRIALIDPLPYPDLLEIIRRAYVVISDSGGIQEEVPSFRKPILILRDCTERPEVVTSGFGILVGTAPADIQAAVNRILDDSAAYERMTSGVNPFGDGHAAERIVNVVLDRLSNADGQRAPKREQMDGKNEPPRGPLAIAV